MTYERLIEEMVAIQTNTLGDAAVDIARRVDGLAVNGDGTVESVDGDGARIADELVSAYVDDLGGAAAVTLRSVADDYADELELPPNLH